MSPSDDLPPPILLDITRSLRRLRLPVPTGIDRVERAYLDWAARCNRAAVMVRVGRRQLVIAEDAVSAVPVVLDSPGDELGGLDLRGSFRPDRPRRERAAEAGLRRLAARSVGGKDLRAWLRGTDRPGVYLNVGHSNLDPATIAVLRAAGWQSLILLHDVIPIEHPELSRPEAPGRMAELLRAAGEASALIVNSADTGEKVQAAAARLNLTLPPIATLPLGVDLSAGPPSTAGGWVEGGGGPADRLHPTPAHPHFLCLGTIEARKNHLLLLRLWRHFWDTRPVSTTPHLHVVGRRGWECEQVIDHLQRAPMMGITVFEHAGLDDGALAQLMSGTRALLFPSFAEGYGLPLAEALAAGIPAIAADLPAMRGVGGNVPEWLDPLDGLGWRAAIDAYAATPSGARAAQLERLKTWSPPLWSDHFQSLENLLSTLIGD
ncbi:MAG: glycosyltransferase [Pseudomonadota bacterium]